MTVQCMHCNLCTVVLVFESMHRISFIVSYVFYSTHCIFNCNLYILFYLYCSKINVDTLHANVDKCNINQNIHFVVNRAGLIRNYI